MPRFLFFLIITVLVVTLLWLLLQGKESSKLVGKNSVCFEDTCFNVEVAESNEARRKGLMYRESLGENEGMLFIFDEETIHAFWMKNTLIPLDAVWISSDYKIVDIQTMTPCKESLCSNYIPAGISKYVLEVNAGVAQKMGIGKGNKVSVKLN